MKKNSLILVLIVFIGFGFQSCSFNSPSLPHSKGKTLEMLVITNNKEQWNSNIGDTITNFFGQTILGLPQAEVMYSMVHLPEEAFIKMYQSNRDVFIVDINQDIAMAQIETKKDLWASPQRVVKISAPDNNSFFEIFNKNKEGILELFNKIERERMIKTFRGVEHIGIKNTLVRKFNFSLTLPSAYKIAKQDSNFIWIRKETLEDSQGLLIYTYPYTDADAFELNTIVSLRNQITKKYIPGSVKGSYMQVADSFIPPVSKEINFNNMFTVETRGLWETAGDFMGGPFLSYTLVDESKNRVITLDSYVYAPSKNKRNLLKQLEAIIYSIELNE